ncbi:MAG: sigma-70 family RNA polymerase sigma factor [Bacteroidales bacterium]|nr:sigma-70 family RNA polymerase sigma factor [Bacteroidales bacterium]
MNFREGQRQNIHRHLIERCRKQDQAAQFEIYKLYYKAMYNTALRMVNNPADAEDIMQESFLQAFTKINTYKGEVDFGAWLKKIVINKSIDLLRSRKAIFEVIDDTVKNYETEEYSLENEEEIIGEVNRIKQAIAGLADGYRVVLSLYLIEGYDHEEIGQILKITPSGSRSQLTRAKQKLTEILNKQEDEKT